MFAATVVGWHAYRSVGSLPKILRPVTVHDPLTALELGLDDVVRGFVADIDRKDQITRDHVVRTAELAMRVGSEMGLSADRLHVLGLGALLHDLGKVAVPGHILKKAGRLTDEETTIMRTHTIVGADMVASSNVLHAVAGVVRHHHERVDGGGYPFGLVGATIPIEARIVSACDAFDAMANSRQYRQGMGVAKAVSILREHQGSQWDEAVVDSLVRLVGHLTEAPTALVFAGVGREHEDVGLESLLGPCGCAELPDLVGV